jgi:hypothetical protein
MEKQGIGTAKNLKNIQKNNKLLEIKPERKHGKLGRKKQIQRELTWEAHAKKDCGYILRALEKTLNKSNPSAYCFNSLVCCKSQTLISTK